MSAREVHELDKLVELGLFCSRSDAVRHCVSEYLIRARIERDRPRPGEVFRITAKDVLAEFLAEPRQDNNPFTRRCGDVIIKHG